VTPNLYKEMGYKEVAFLSNKIALNGEIACWKSSLNI